MLRIASRREKNAGRVVPGPAAGAAFSGLMRLGYVADTVRLLLLGWVRARLMHASRLISITVLLAGISAGFAARRYNATGLTISVDRARQTVVISHESIPGYMDAMAMPFRVKDAASLNGLVPGTKVDFTLVVENGSSWIEKLHPVEFWSAERDPEQARRLGLIESIIGKSKANQLGVGQPVPNFTLPDQSNRATSLAQFAGKVVALNFVYTRCPLPDYCFRLSNNLAQLQKRFAARMGRDLILVTITFDPVHDTPAVMADYAHIWNADLKAWHFLTGPLAEVQRVCGIFGVAAWQDEGILTHSLHTAVIDRNGKLAANIEGNLYTAKQLGDLVEEVMNRPAARP
jgi:protein SCO1/2